MTGDAEHCATIHGTICPLKPGPHDADYREAARRLYVMGGKRLNDGDADIDDKAVVSASDEGAYVAAWLWVPREEIGLPSLDEALDTN